MTANKPSSVFSKNIHILVNLENCWIEEHVHEQGIW
jgi:hypothetical protein